MSTIERLAENAGVNGVNVSRKLLGTCAAEYKALATRVETLERDAIRYRYLRKNPTMLLHLKNSEFDSAIDAALAHSQEVGNG